MADVSSALSLAPLQAVIIKNKSEPYRLSQFHRQRMEAVISRIRNRSIRPNIMM
jgi:hypothetical protein